MAAEPNVTTDASEPGRKPALRWPPPGLERMQGDLFGIASRAALAGGLLVLPLLFVIAREQTFASLGPFADAWWVTLVLASVGLAFALDAIARTARALRRAARAIERGYDLATVLRVAADAGKDMGFLLTGARHFSVMDVRERDAVAAIRVAAAVLLAFGGIWVVVAMSVGLLFAADGRLTPSAFLVSTLLPAGLAYVTGGVANLVQQGRVRRSRRIWFSHPWADDLTAEEIRGWQSRAADASPSIETRAQDAPAPSARVLAGAGIAVGTLAIVIAVPVMTLVPTSAVGPILTTVSAPAGDNYRPRAARAETFRSFAVEGDVSITAAEAGQLAHDLAYVGSAAEPSPGERDPSRRVAESWLPTVQADANPMGIAPHLWGDSLLARVAAGITPAQRRYLADVADHPAASDFSRLARATDLDLGQARWAVPFPPGLTVATLPVPRLASYRDAANARIGAAAYAFEQGRRDEAETILTEVISVGFLLGDYGPTLVDNFVGLALIESGGGALGELYRVSGDLTAAAELSRIEQVSERTANMMRTEFPEGSEAWVRSLPGMVLDSALVRGLRWEYFISLSTMAPCLNMHRMVFGADEEYDAFVEDARAALVRWPSEEAVFEIARYGWAGVVDPGSPSLFGRVVGLYMNTDENSCGRLIRLLQARSVL